MPPRSTGARGPPTTCAHVYEDGGGRELAYVAMQRADHSDAWVSCNPASREDHCLSWARTAGRWPHLIARAHPESLHGYHPGGARLHNATRYRQSPRLSEPSPSAALPLDARVTPPEYLEHDCTRGVLLRPTTAPIDLRARDARWGGRSASAIALAPCGDTLAPSLLPRDPSQMPVRVRARSLLPSRRSASRRASSPPWPPIEGRPIGSARSVPIVHTCALSAESHPMPAGTAWRPIGNRGT